MKVSYYELLGLIKDDKNPKKVVYKDIVYIWSGENYTDKNKYYISNYINEIDIFDKEIYLLPDE